MELMQFFETDDGSLPEIEVGFREPRQAAQVFRHLFELGGRDVSIGGATVWLVEDDCERPFEGASDAELLIEGNIEPFHVVLGNVQSGGVCLPDLGVWLNVEGITLDYRMGAEWGREQVEGLVLLLRRISDIGGHIAVPWWGADGERIFRESINRA